MSSCQRTHEPAEHEGAAFWFLLPADGPMGHSLNRWGKALPLEEWEPFAR
jgi:hypothetical protein